MLKSQKWPWIPPYPLSTNQAIYNSAFPVEICEHLRFETQWHWCAVWEAEVILMFNLLAVCSLRRLTVAPQSCVKV